MEIDCLFWNHWKQHQPHDYITQKSDKKHCNERIKSEAISIQNFILWHYQFGSKFNTPFWEYAKSLPFEPGSKFESVTNYSIKNSYSDIVRQRYRDRKNFLNYGFYSHWSAYSFKIWTDGMGLTPS